MKDFRDELVKFLSKRIMAEMVAETQAGYAYAIKQMSATMFCPDGCLGVWHEVAI